MRKLVRSLELFCRHPVSDAVVQPYTPAASVVDAKDICKEKHGVKKGSDEIRIQPMLRGP
jgi:hypothetical protein